MDYQQSQHAYILHQRPYQDNSVIVEVFSELMGRQSMVAKHVRSKKSSKAALLQPFLPVQIAWRGRSQLKSLVRIETQSSIWPLVGDHLYSGFYLNELLWRLLPLDESVPSLFTLYHQSLEALSQQQDLDGVLRRFEWHVIDSLGFAIDFGFCVDNNEEIAANGFYRYYPSSGWHSAFPADQDAVNGEVVLAIRDENWQHPLARLTLKKVLRAQLHQLLDGRELKSRELLIASRGNR